MKNTLLLLVTALLLTAGAGRSQAAPSQSLSFIISGAPAQPSTAMSLPLGSSGYAVLAARSSDFAHDLNKAGDASFAQLNGNTRSMPFPSVWLLTLVAVVVLFWRALDVRRAKSLADHEHHINRSREQMYRSLYKHD
jgi:hypothetical protein